MAPDEDYEAPDEDYEAHEFSNKGGTMQGVSNFRSHRSKIVERCSGVFSFTTENKIMSRVSMNQYTMEKEGEISASYIPPKGSWKSTVVRVPRNFHCSSTGRIKISL